MPDEVDLGVRTFEVAGLLSLALLLAPERHCHAKWVKLGFVVLVLAQVWVVLVDLRLLDRLWGSTLLLTMLYLVGGETWARAGFLVLPAAGPLGLASFLFVPLLIRPERRLVLALSLYLCLQGHLSHNLDLTLFALALLPALFAADQPACSKPQQAGCLLGCLMAALLSWRVAQPLRTEIVFEYQGIAQHLTVVREVKEVRLLVDGRPLNGPWREGEALLANPLFFQRNPQLLSWPMLYHCYGSELKRRHGATRFHFQINSKSRDG